jgi:hypothetical protein
VLILLLTACAEVLALILRLTGGKTYSAWVLAIGTLPALGQMVNESSEAAHRGAPMTASDTEFLAAELAILALALLSRWRLSRVLFWTGWTLNLALLGVFGYVVFLWHPFT